jgi:hypothetical protein
MTETKDTHEPANGVYGVLSAAFLLSKGFKLVEESQSPFENFKMNYFVKEGVILFFNTPVTEWNENDFLVGCGEMSYGKYYAVAFRWIKEQKDIIEIYKAVKGKDLDSVG